MGRSLYVVLGLLAIPTLVLIAGGYNNWLVGLEYQREIGVYFEYADRASDAKLKSENFNKYVSALEEHGLTEGATSIYFKEQPNAQLGENFKVAKSLQKRLNSLAEMDEASEAYQYGMRQVTMQEFCWFPTYPFYQAYALKHGAWGVALTPGGAYDRCYQLPSD